MEIISKVNSNSQEMMNLLATCYNWANVVYDTETPENVTQLWASEKVYLELSSGKVYTKSADGFANNVPSTISYSAYTIFKSDLGVGLAIGSNPHLTFVGKTKKPDGTESAGIVSWTGSYEYYFVVFTDEMTSATYFNQQNSVANSTTNTQLVPIYSRSSDEYFTDLSWCFMRTNTTNEKLVLEGEKYLATKYLAVRYTE